MRNRGRERSPSQEASQERRPPNPSTQSPKRRRSSPNSEDSSRSGRSTRGRFHRSRSKRSATPPPRREANPSMHAHRRRRSPSPTRRETHAQEQRRRRSPSPPMRQRRTPSPSDSPSSDDEASSASSKRSHNSNKSRRKHPAWKRSQKIAPKFREGGKNVTFLTYDGTYGDTDKILAFIQQFDAAFGGENFQEASKLRHVAMYLQKSGRQWWASLKTRGKAPKTWKACRAAIMK